MDSQCSGQYTNLGIVFFTGIISSLYAVLLYFVCKTNCFQRRAKQKELKKFRKCFKSKHLVVEENAVEFLDDTVLGEGNSGGVSLGNIIKKSARGNSLGWTGPTKINRIPVAIKVINPAKHSLKEMLEEAMLMSELQHPNIVRLLGVCFVRNNVPLVLMEPMFGTNLMEYLHRVRIGNRAGISVSDLCNMMEQVCDAVAFIHSNNIVHRDIAARNVMLVYAESMSSVKLTDFGLSRRTIPLENKSCQAYEEKSASRELPLTYLPPEYFITRQFWFKSDSWMLGILGWEICTYGLQPYRNLQQNPARLRHTICSPIDAIRWLPLSNDLPYPICEILRNCWKLSHFDRPSALDLVNQFVELASDPLVSKFIFNIEEIQPSFPVLHSMYLDSPELMGYDIPPAIDPRIQYDSGIELRLSVDDVRDYVNIIPNGGNQKNPELVDNYANSLESVAVVNTNNKSSNNTASYHKFINIAGNKMTHKSDGYSDPSFRPRENSYDNKSYQICPDPSNRLSTASCSPLNRTHDSGFSSNGTSECETELVNMKL